MADEEKLNLDEGQAGSGPGEEQRADAEGSVPQADAAGSAEAPETPEQAPEGPEKNWYIIHTY